MEMGRWAGESAEYESKMNHSEAERVVQILEWGTLIAPMCLEVRAGCGLLPGRCGGDHSLHGTGGCSHLGPLLLPGAAATPAVAQPLPGEGEEEVARLGFCTRWAIE